MLTRILVHANYSVKIKKKNNPHQIKRGRRGCPVRRDPRYAFDTGRQNIIYPTLFFIGENEKQNYNWRYIVNNKLFSCVDFK